MTDREDGCEYCKGHTSPLAESRYARLYINTFRGARTLEVESNNCPPYADCGMRGVPIRSVFIINYCPICGRDLQSQDKLIESHKKEIISSHHLTI